MGVYVNLGSSQGDPDAEIVGMQVEEYINKLYDIQEEALDNGIVVDFCLTDPGADDGTRAIGASVKRVWKDDEL